MRILAASVLFIVGITGFAVAQIPLAAVVGWAGLEKSGLNFKRAEGTLWSGKLIGASVGPMHLGTVHLSAQPLALLTGQAGMHFSFNGAGLTGEGSLKAGLSGELVAENTDVVVGLAHMPTVVPMSGTLRVSDATIRMRQDGCADATGIIKTDLVIHYSGNARWSGPQLSGPVVCSNGDLRLPLAGAKGSDKIVAEMRLKRDLETFEAKVDVNTRQDKVKKAMALLGFVRNGDTFTYTQQGQLSAIMP